MKFFHIPESLANKNLYKANTRKKNFVRMDKQKFALLENTEELNKALQESKTVVSFSDFGFKNFLELNQITPLDEDQEAEEVLENHPICSVHLLSPVYSATGKFLALSGILFGAGAPVYCALPFALTGAACNFWVQYHFITKSASGPKSLDFNADAVAAQQSPQWKNELMALTTAFSSVAEGAAFAASTFLTADANNLGTTAAIVLSLIAFKFRQGTTMQADGQKIFIEQGKNFADTYVGTVLNWTQQFPPGYPFLLDFNSWVRDLLPALESLMPVMAFKAFLERRIDNTLLCTSLATLMGSGEWYQQRGYSVNLIKHVQQLANTKAPLGFAHVVDIIIRVYNETIGNLVNGRFVNDAIGIVIPPAIYQLIIKMSGNFFLGYVNGREAIKMLPVICDKIGIQLPNDYENIEVILKPVVGSICAIAAASQYRAGYDKNLRGLPIGIKSVLNQVYNNASLTGWHTQDIVDRYQGWTKYMKSWPQRFFRLGKDVVNEFKENYCCKQTEADDEDLHYQALEEGRLEQPLTDVEKELGPTVLDHWPPRVEENYCMDNETDNSLTNNSQIKPSF